MSDIAPDAGGRSPSIPFWRDSRVLGMLAQIAFFALVVAGLAGLGRNVAGNMGRLGENQFLCRDGSSSFRCAFDFLRLDSNSPSPRRSSRSTPATPTAAPCSSAR